MRAPTNKNDNKNPKHISNSIFLALRRDILSGKMKKGEKLTEQELCNIYGVSRTPVREAILQLESEGLVECIPNRGAFILGFSSKEIADLHVLRDMYEIQAAIWAAERITDEELSDLEEAMGFLEFYSLKKDLKKLKNISSMFHEKIYKATHCRSLYHSLTTYQLYLDHLVQAPSDSESYIEEVLLEHKKIFDAIKARDPIASEQAMREHMQGAALRDHH